MKKLHPQNKAVKIMKKEKFVSIGKMHPLIIDDERIIIFRHGKIYSYDIISGAFSSVCNLKMPILKKVVSYSRIAERTLRIEPRCAVKFKEEGIVLSFAGAIYYINEKSKTSKIEHHFRTGMSNTLQLVPICDIRGFADSIVYGEYWQNPNREAVRIFARSGGTWEPVFTFPAGTIKHVHGMISDRKRNCVYIFTGDDDKESGIWVAKENFKSVEPLLIGNKNYRTCVGFADESGLLIATDNPFETNFLRYIKLTEEGKVSTINDIMQINGPCIYGTQWKNSLVFSTSVEQDYTTERNLLIDVFSRKLGKGTKTDETVIYLGNMHAGFSEIVRYKKDMWPMGLCAFGTVKFPQEMNQDILCIYPISVKKFDGATVIYNQNISEG